MGGEAEKEEGGGGRRREEERGREGEKERGKERSVFCNDTATKEIDTHSLHDDLPISQTTRNGAYTASFPLHGLKSLKSNCSRPYFSKSQLPLPIYLIHPKGLLITNFSPLSALTLCWLIGWSIGPLAHWPIGLLVCHNYLFVCLTVFRLFTVPCPTAHN